MFPATRMRRLRRKNLRELVAESALSPSDLIYPVFVDEGIHKRKPIPSMPEQYRLPIGEVADEVRQCQELGLGGVILFGVPTHKDEQGSSAWGHDDVIQKAVRSIRDELGGEPVVMTDVCMCEYTTHGHCGILKGSEVDNDRTLESLKKIAVSHAEAGADIVAPSGMMDGMVMAIREGLDGAGYSDVAIMSYAAKYASSLYSPFRDAADSGYAFGDRRSYQMDARNSDEALREVELDILEGADIVMVKPALGYLDIVRRVKESFKMPTAVYSVSGEYAMIKAAAQAGWLNEDETVDELLYCMRRSGADIVITYSAKQWGVRA
ncbi:MAG: porphobilinogen synthase [Methermicoccaceae archaeon]